MTPKFSREIKYPAEVEWLEKALYVTTKARAYVLLIMIKIIVMNLERLLTLWYERRKLQE